MRRKYLYIKFAILLFMAGLPALCMAQADSIKVTAEELESFSDAAAVAEGVAEMTDTVSEMFTPRLFDPVALLSLADSLTSEFSDFKVKAPEQKPNLRGASMREKDSLLMVQVERKHSTDWSPTPRKAVLLSMIIPGGGQIYNRKYWKLPIFYGGYLGCVYALTWNNQTYHDYMQAYVDILDDDPETTSYMDFLPSTYDVEANKDWLSSVLKNRKDMYRRYRDISIFCFAGVYLLSIIDAYVDAELSHFDVSRDLSLDVNPGITVTDHRTASLGLNLSLTF